MPRGTPICMHYVSAKAWACRFRGAGQIFQLSYKSAPSLQSFAKKLREDACAEIVSGASTQTAKATAVAEFLCKKRRLPSAARLLIILAKICPSAARLYCSSINLNEKIADLKWNQARNSLAFTATKYAHVYNILPAYTVHFIWQLVFHFSFRVWAQDVRFRV